MANLDSPGPKNAMGVFKDIYFHGWYISHSCVCKDLQWGGNPMFWYAAAIVTLNAMHGWLGDAGLFWKMDTSVYHFYMRFLTIIREAFPGMLYTAKMAKSLLLT